MRISIIVAMAEKSRVIGRKGKLPWHLPSDLKRFKETTMGHVVVMGRKTFESIGKPLPGRKNIIITSDDSYKHRSCLVAHSLEEAFKLAGDAPEVFVIGGAQIYAQAMSLADRLLVTSVLGNVKGDAYFPKIDKRRWEFTTKEYFLNDDPHGSWFIIYERKRKSQPSR